MVSGFFGVEGAISETVVILDSSEAKVAGVVVTGIAFMVVFEIGGVDFLGFAITGVVFTEIGILAVVLGMNENAPGFLIGEVVVFEYLGVGIAGLVTTEYLAGLEVDVAGIATIVIGMEALVFGIG